MDTLRGLGVVFMVQLHTSHGWLMPGARSGDIWTATQFFGGLAAPIFLTLAGVSLGLQWGRAESTGRSLQRRRHIARGLQLVVLGYALRLQMWVIDSGAYGHSISYVPIACLLAAYALAYCASAALDTQPRRAAQYGAAALAVWLAGIALIHAREPERLRGLLRVDVLQCIGASLVFLNLVTARSEQRAPSRSALFAWSMAIGLATHWLRTFTPTSWPEGVAAYLTQWPAPAGKSVVGLFPLFPWTAYACAGAAFGLHWSRARAQGSDLETRLVTGMALGAWLALLTSEAWPPMYRFTRDYAWLAPLIRLSYKLGLVLMLSGVALAFARATTPFLAPLRSLGRASLLVYWVHLEFAFGAAARPLLHRLDLAGWSVATGALVVAMWLLAVLRERTARSGWSLQRRRIATG